VTAGDFVGQGYDQFVVAFQDRSTGNPLSLARLDYRSGLGDCNSSRISPFLEVASLSTSRDFDVAGGDFNGDGLAEGVVVWTDGSSAHLQVFRGGVGMDRPSLSSDLYLEKDAGPYYSVTTGDVNGDSIDEIILAWGGSDKDHPVHVGVFQVKPVSPEHYWYTIARIDAWQTPDWCWQPSVEVGDFNLDGIDEIVVSAKGWKDEQVHLYILALSKDEAKNQWQLTQKATQTGGSPSNYPRLAVGDVNRDVKAEIVSTYTTGGEYTVNVQVFDVNAPSSGAWSIASKGKVSDERSTSDGYASVFVALGNLDAKQLRVGPPSHTLASNVLSTLAVIHMPPKHKDTVGGQTYDINPDKCASPPCHGFG